MSSILVMLPESYPVAERLCRYVFEENRGKTIDLLILKKQEKKFERIIKSLAFKNVHVIDEDYYGRVTKDSTASFLRSMFLSYAVAYFPLNTFRANAYFLGSVLAKETRCVNSSLYGKRKDVPVVKFSLEGGKSCEARVPWAAELDTIVGAKDKIVSVLKKKKDTMEATGERPTFGILSDDAHDLEIFCKYAFAADYARSKNVMDIGGGMGFGSFLLSSFAKKVIFLDKSGEPVKLVKELWSGLKPNLVPVQADVGELEPEEMSVDVAVLMDVIEHVPDPEKVLKSAKRMLKEDGVLIVSTPEEDVYPYSVCPPERWNDNAEKLLDEAIWPWHIQALGESKLLPMLERAGFKVVEKNYVTYLKGYEFRKGLRDAVKKGDIDSAISLLNKLTRWHISDFGITDERDPHFSASSYNIVAKKAA